ncbi:MotA/TolQ/ExbB proton channel family protein [Endozoicomonas numazuensis]|uniref:MotA/TolQ/ExbB proton channel family protein n=1 Tax=Endozoicomonas numazuensis TaxID=1137799 RepID=UPI00068CE4C8|nr:MotA/TolQ/ExbB proton channel family protein [Endozoicomonas numazuensis]
MEQILISIRDFLELGGTVLTVIAVVTGVLWILVLERIYYLKFHHPKMVKKALTLWQAQDHSEPWFTQASAAQDKNISKATYENDKKTKYFFQQKLKRRLMSLVNLKLERNLALIKTLIAVCPLLGLLGTVTGMLEVFEVMSFTGTGNARAMASGVSKATVPTMAGMVTALSGILIITWLLRTAQKEKRLLNERMLNQAQSPQSITTKPLSV